MQAIKAKRLEIQIYSSTSLNVINSVYFKDNAHIKEYIMCHTDIINIGGKR